MMTVDPTTRASRPFADQPQANVHIPITRSRIPRTTPSAHAQRPPHIRARPTRTNTPASPRAEAPPLSGAFENQPIALSDPSTRRHDAQRRTTIGRSGCLIPSSVRTLPGQLCYVALTLALTASTAFAELMMTLHAFVAPLLSAPPAVTCMRRASDSPGTTFSL
jgi:hypothetical protein